MTFLIQKHKTNDQDHEAGVEDDDLKQQPKQNRTSSIPSTSTQQQVDHLTGPSSCTLERSKDPSPGLITTTALITGQPLSQHSSQQPSLGAGRGASGTVQIHPSDPCILSTTTPSNISGRQDEEVELEGEEGGREETSESQLVTVRISKL